MYQKSLGPAKVESPTLRNSHGMSSTMTSQFAEDNDGHKLTDGRQYM